MEFNHLVVSIKDLAQIIFWVIGSCVAIKSYRHAKVSIFQPAKNEVFKVQIAALQALLREISWKSSIETWSESGLASSFQVNINRCFREYAKDQFDANMSSQNDKQLSSVGAIISSNARGFRLIKGPADMRDYDDEFSKEDFSWSEFTWETFDFTEQFRITDDLISSAINDPVMPLKIQQSVKALHEELTKTVLRTAEDLEKAVRQFPRHYPTRESLQGADLTWTHNMSEERGEKLFQALDALKKNIRAYLQSDELLESK